jgi:hypothetical protein
MQHKPASLRGYAPDRITILPNATPSATAGDRAAHDPEKWEPVFGQDHAQTKNFEA